MDWEIAPSPSAIAEYFKDAGKRLNARATFGEEYLRVYGEAAVSTGYYTFSDVQDGKEVLRPPPLQHGLPESKRKMGHRSSPFLGNAVI